MKYILFVTIIGLLLSCNSSKNLQRNESKTDSTWYWKAQELNIDIQKLRQENQQLQLETSKGDIVFESQPCPNIDSLLSLDSAGRENAKRTIGQLQNQLEVAADGSFKARGAIKSYKTSNEKLTSELQLRESIIADLQKRLAEDSGHAKTEIVVKTVEKKVQFIPIWLVVLAGIGWLLSAVGLIAKLRSKLSPKIVNI